MTRKDRAVLLLWAVWAVVFVIGVVQALPDTPVPLAPVVAWLLLGLSIVVFLAAVPALISLVRNSITALRAPAGVPPVTLSAMMALNAAMGVTAAIVGLLVYQGDRAYTFGPGTDEPPRTVDDPTAPTHRDSLLAYARRLDYDSVTHGAADSAWLTETATVGGQERVVRTVRGWIYPERRANFNTFADLDGTGRGKGRIVARVWIDPADTLGYQPLKLPPGASYIWIDSLRRTGDTTGTARTLIIPVDPRYGVRVLRNVKYMRSSRASMNFAMARWLLSRRSECTNTPCPWHGCCWTCPDGT